jgi:hypothetical protein
MVSAFKKISLLVLLFVVVLSASGCFALFLGAAAGAGGYAWVSGALEKDYLNPAEKLEQATNRGLKDLQLVIKEQERDRLSAKIRTQFADGQSVNIDIKALTEKSARLRIRVGVFGNRTRSEMVLNAIEKHVGDIL